MSKSLFVRNAPEGVTKEDLVSAFSPFGEVLPSTRVVRSRPRGAVGTGAGRLLCFVDFASDVSAQAALHHQPGVMVRGVAVVVEEERVQPSAEMYFAPVASEEVVRDLLSGNGLPAPVKVRMATKPSATNGEMFAFVQFADEDENNQVAEVLNGKANGDKVLTVQRSRRGGGGDFHHHQGPASSGGAAAPRMGGGGARRAPAPPSASSSSAPAPRRTSQPRPSSSTSGVPASSSSAAGAAPGTTLHVGNLPPHTSPEILKTMFEAFGPVTRVVQKGHANTTVFVEFDGSAGMEKAVAQAFHDTAGKLHVSVSKGKANSVHVLGLDGVSEASIRDSFGKYGKVVSVNVLEPHSYAFVTYANADDAHKALNMTNVLTINSVPLTIVESTSVGGRR